MLLTCPITSSLLYQIRVLIFFFDAFLMVRINIQSKPFLCVKHKAISEVKPPVCLSLITCLDTITWVTHSPELANYGVLLDVKYMSIVCVTRPGIEQHVQSMILSMYSVFMIFDTMSAAVASLAWSRRYTTLWIKLWLLP